MLSHSHTILVFVVFNVLFILVRRLTRRPSMPLPPGPSGHPFIGNLLQVDTQRPHTQFTEWAKQYGEIFSLCIGSQVIVVLNSAAAAQELFVNRGALYASRAPPHVAQDIISAGQRILFTPYGARWRIIRRALQSAIGPGPSRNIRKMQELESRVLLRDLLMHGDKSLETPVAHTSDEIPEEHWFSEVRRYSLSVVMYVTYGKRVSSKMDNNPHFRRIFDVLGNIVKRAQPGSYVADAFPFMRRLPDFLAPWRVAARKMHTWEMELWGGLLEESKKLQNSNGFVPTYMRARSDAGHVKAPGCGATDDGWMRDTLLAYSAGSVLEAGSDTTSGAIQLAVLFFLSNPDVLAKARTEVDAVVGPTRLPDFGDEPQLPYITACAKEVLRRRPLTPMGVPHAVTADDVYKGYLIPKGAMVIGNVWAMHTDETHYPDPLAFSPERFLHPSMPLEQYTFGWGRRMCQGRHVAEASLFLVLARLVWGFDMRAHELPDPADESVAGTFSVGFVSVPRPFNAGFSARTGRAPVILAAYEDAQQEWETLGLERDVR